MYGLLDVELLSIFTSLHHGIQLCLVSFIGLGWACPVQMEHKAFPCRRERSREEGVIGTLPLAVADQIRFASPKGTFSGILSYTKSF